jgi:ABC-2 type transport system ATP-binding protein
MMGLIRPTTGTASILGHDVRQTGFRRHIGFLPENPYFYDHLTAREILHFYARLSGMNATQRRERVETLLSWVGLEHAATARLRTYSKGMLQRVGIAQALVHDPSVVFLDEPMSGLDPLGRKEIRDIILRLKGEGKTVFMNTHILSDVEMICDRVAIIVSGEIRYQGSIEQFLSEDDMWSDVVLSSVPTEAAHQIEEEFSAQFKGIGDRIEIRVRDKDVNAVVRCALDAGAQLISVAHHRVSLERIFLDTVEQSQLGAAEEAGR